eukprot:jgi/Ulvmu1/11059/UM007_0241.1
MPLLTKHCQWSHQTLHYSHETFHYSASYLPTARLSPAQIKASSAHLHAPTCSWVPVSGLFTNKDTLMYPAMISHATFATWPSMAIPVQQIHAVVTYSNSKHCGPSAFYETAAITSLQALLSFLFSQAPLTGAPIPSASTQFHPHTTTKCHPPQDAA